MQKIEEIPTVISRTAENYKPHNLANYAYELATIFNAFYVHTPKIKDESDENLKLFRVYLIDQAMKNLKTCFDLLGIKMPTKM